MLLSIKFTAHYGTNTKEVDISEALGSHGSVSLVIDKYYQGVFIKSNGVWRYEPQRHDKNDLTSDDIMILIDMIEQEIAKIKRA